MPGGISRVAEMLESAPQDSRRTESHEVVKMFNRQVIIYPKYGPMIQGLYVGEKRLYEYSRDAVLVVQVATGRTVFIHREDVSYIEVSESGYVTENLLPE